MQLIDDVSQLFELHFSFLLQHQHTLRLRFRPCPRCRGFGLGDDSGCLRVRISAGLCGCKEYTDCCKIAISLIVATDECSPATTLSCASEMFESAQSGSPPPVEGVRAARHARLQVTGLSHESWIN